MRDQADFAENENGNGWARLEFLLILVCFALAWLLIWIVSKTDAGASWGW